ncbi:EAL domain-containing protein [Luteimonas viscosa]|uniref:EAL domain-containing protein n=1 Tax=Luteimonas viscosa TaxID=1132694 RepID=A0A5D4XNX9_9GAMM|nr:EAL domain-containing protein [Luteimonas viscosa]TYT25491.1 EAL domain-containing protein [Luteimonas viscosa]
MAADPLARSPGSASTVRTVGIGLGLVLMAGLAVLLLQDRQARLDAAHRQSLALATGVDRLLHYGLRNLSRAMEGIAADAATWAVAAPGQEGALVEEAIAGVAARHPELHSIVLVDSNGAALSTGMGDPELPQWIPHARTEAGLTLGSLQEDGHGGWWLRLAAPFSDGRWLLARLETTEIEGMIRDLDIGRDGNVTVLDGEGVVLAYAPDAGAARFVGRRIGVPADVRNRAGTMSRQSTSSLDGIERAQAFSATSGYSVVVTAGIGMEEAMAPWHRLAAIASAIALLYWAGLAYLMRRLSAAARAQAGLMDELHAQAHWLDQAQQAARTGVWRVEPDDQTIRVSAHTAAMFGFEPVDMMQPAQVFFDRIHRDDRARVEALFAEAQRTGTPYVAEYRVVSGNGQERWISARGGIAGDDRGGRRLAGTVVDITDRHEAQARIERAEAQFRALFERNPLSFFVFDAKTLRFLAVNQAAVASYGYSVEEFLSMSILDIRPPDEVEAVLASMRRRSPEQDVDGVWTHMRSDGSRLEARVFSSSIEFGGRAARLVLAEDVSDRVAYERDLAWRATHDATTGLSTLAALCEQLDAMVADGRTRRYAVAYLRLRELELVATTLGQRVGEEVLREIAARIAMVGVEYGLAGYWPGQSFVVVALDPSRGAAMLAALEQAMAAPVDMESGAHPIEASIGIAEGPEPGETAEQVAGHAALAALQAWQDQVPTLPYDRAMAAQAAERMALARRLREALDKREFELHFQPIHRLSDDRVVAVEALLRWRQHDGGYVPPDVFVPLAEASGLILPIGQWVLEEAARSHGRLAGRGLDHVAIAVNVSAVQLLTEGLSEAIVGLQRKYGLPAGALHVELTESVVLRRPQAARVGMLQLRAAGVRISIDDFGTGFSSMAYLRDLPLDCLKIDRSFVRQVHADERNASICRALIALARGLGLGTIAEGVESAEELEWLRRNGCEQAQGYHLGRPVPLERLLDSIGGPG